MDLHVCNTMTIPQIFLATLTLFTQMMQKSKLYIRLGNSNSGGVTMLHVSDVQILALLLALLLSQQ